MTRATVVYSLAMFDEQRTNPPFMAQLVLPRDLTKEEADRLCAMIQTLVIQPDAYLARVNCA